MKQSRQENPVISYISQILLSNNKKKIIIYGCGAAGARIYAYLKVMGYEAAYFLDMNSAKQGSKAFGLPIKSPYDLLYDSDYIVFLSVIDNAASAREVLEGMGLLENQDYFNVMHFWGGRKKYDLLDPFCGYSRKGELDGFQISGNRESKNRILILGGSTSDDDYSEFKSWGKFLYELLYQEWKEDFAIYNGAVSGYNSSQELLKLLRDCIKLKPSIIIEFNGVNDIYGLESNHPMVNDYLQYIFRIIAAECSGSVLDQAPKIGMQSDKNLNYTFGLSSDSSNYENWLFNMKIANAVCREFGIKYYGILQPISVFGQHEDHTIRQVNEIQILPEDNKKRKDFYVNAKKECGQHEFLYDFTDIFEGHEEALYFDEVHYTETANKIIAEKIYDLIKFEFGSK